LKEDAMRIFVTSLSSALLIGFIVAAAGCDPPKDLQVGKAESGLAVIDWHTAAMGLYVTSPDAEIPTGPGGKVKGGHVFWVIEATTFPSGFRGPVTYGALPNGAKDATEKHGGVAGGETLQPGITYKFAVVSLGGQLSLDVSW
jgi:hypothetical protein